MNVAISGATGFIGQALRNRMRQLGWTIRMIDRESLRLNDVDFCLEKIEGADVVINLAGAPVAAKWTAEYKQEILNSRLLTTTKIARAINQATKKPAAFLSSSAIGIYSGEGSHDESSTSFATGFLARVCQEWEASAMLCCDSTRVVIFRTGVVLGKEGGALAKMHRPFSIGLGARIGDGSQAVSFIHIADLIDALLFIIENESLSGVVNLVSPFPSTNYEFSDKLGKVLTQPVWLAIPAFAMKMIYGEGAQVLLQGQNVSPKKLIDAGFRFRYPTIQNALVAIYR